jgi:hypothetical protein
LKRSKSPQEERAIIIKQPSKRPYGVRLRIHVKSEYSIGNLEQVCVSLSTGAFFSMMPTKAAPWEGGKKYDITLEGFPTAALAEAAGRRLVQALLWLAISLDSPLRLEYLSYEPASVFERNRPAGVSVSALGYGLVGQSPVSVLTEIHDAYAELPEPDPKVLLSMEIFCAARLESSQRAVFLTMVSALEPLANEAKLEDTVVGFVNDCINRLKANDAISSESRISLEGRPLLLRQESKRQALRRLAIELLPEASDPVRIIDQAYALRSQLIHNGVPDDLDIDLEREGRSVSAVIRSIYAAILKRSLLIQMPSYRDSV